MRKLVALLLTLAVTVSCFSAIVFADEAETVAQDGFDFYSMTVHYTENVVVGYEIASDIEVKNHDGSAQVDEDGEQVVLKSGYVFAEAQDSYVIPVCIYTTSEETNQTLAYGDSKVKKYDKSGFYAINSKELGITSDSLSINKNYGLTDISDGSVIGNKSAIQLRGITEYYDDAGTPNPNYTKKDGYFVDKNVDEDGNNYRIDENEFRIDKNGIWHTIDGHRVEPFVEIDDHYVWINLEARKTEDGLIADIDEITNQYLLDLGYITVPTIYQDVDEEFDETKDYDGNGAVGGKNKASDRAAYKELKQAKETWYETTSIELFVIDYKDYTGDGKITTDDLAGYNAADTVIDESQIKMKTLSDGSTMPVYGTPVSGDPLTKVEIKNITLEIDALGESMPADLASDPQQENQIIVTTNEIYENIVLAQDYIAEHPEKVYEDGVILGTAKMVTTKTEVKEEEGYPSTLTSIELELTDGVEIPDSAMLYFNFVVKTSQPENTKTYCAKKDHNLLSINRGKLDVESLEDAATPEPEEETGCKSVISGGVAMVSVLCAAVVALKKKEKF